MAEYSSFEPMIRVGPHRTCPVCGKPTWCLVAADGSAALCQRVEEGAIKRCGEAGWLHKLGQSAENFPRRTVPLAFAQKPKSPLRDWSNGLARWEKSRGTKVDELATALGVTQESLERIGTGYDAASKWWTFPEKDSNGTVIGILRRDQNGVKRRLTNSRCGLCYASDWGQAPGPVLLVEGASCTAAILSIGLCGVGRPSNTGGVDPLIGLLESVPLAREIVVIGERDQKPDGKWPGRTGAISTASQLAESLNRPIAWSFVPDEKKDTRDWLKSAPKGLPVDRLTDLYLSGLNKTWVKPIPVHHSPAQSGPVVKLSDWRTELLAIRVSLLHSPGGYLDSSPTGSGKSYVDLHALLPSSQVEAAPCADF